MAFMGAAEFFATKVTDDLKDYNVIYDDLIYEIFSLVLKEEESSSKVVLKLKDSAKFYRG